MAATTRVSGHSHVWLQTADDSFAEPLQTIRPIAIPFPRDPDFVDRGTLLDELKEKCSMPASRVALVGVGGVG